MLASLGPVPPTTVLTRAPICKHPSQPHRAHQQLRDKGVSMLSPGHEESRSKPQIWSPQHCSSPDPSPNTLTHRDPLVQKSSFAGCGLWGLNSEKSVGFGRGASRTLQVNKAGHSLFPAENELGFLHYPYTDTPPPHTHARMLWSSDRLSPLSLY